MATPLTSVEEWARKSSLSYEQTGDEILLPITSAFKLIEYILSETFDRNKIRRALGDLDDQRKRSMESEESDANPDRLVLYGFIDMVQRVIIHLLQKIDEAQNDSNEKKTLMDEVNKLKENIGKLTDENGMKLDEILALQTAIQDYDIDVANLSSKLAKMTTELSVGGSKIKELKEHLAAEQKELAQTKEKANTDMEAANSQIEKLKKHLDNAKKELAETKDKAYKDLESANAHASGLKNLSLKYLNEQHERQRKDKEELDAKLKEMQLEKEAIERERTDFKSREWEMNAKLERIQTRNAYLTCDNDDLTRKLAELGVKIEEDSLLNENVVGENSHLAADSDDHLSTIPTFTHSSPMESKKEETKEKLNDVTQAITGDTEDSAETVKEGKRRRSSTDMTKLMEDDFSDHSDDDNDPAMKKARSDSDKKTEKDTERSSCKREDQSASAGKEKEIKLNGSELKCPECEFRSLSVGAYVGHLNKVHFTTPILAGIVFRCECGKECVSNSHGRWCPISNFTVIRKRVGPIRRLYDGKTTPKCTLCEAYPITPTAYVAHLHIRHKSTLIEEEIYLLCDCGLKVRSRSDAIHTKECDKHQFTLHEVAKD